MANNITIKDGSSYAVKVKTTETNGTHVPHHNIDNLEGITTSLQSILTELQQNAELPISGSVTINGTLPAFASTPTVNIGTAPTIAVTGNFYPATQLVSLSTNTPTLQASSAIVGKVGIDQTTPGTTNKVSIGSDGTVAISGNVAVTGDFYQATQPISAVNLPLPTLAATSTNQATANTSLASIVTNTANIPSNLTVTSTRLLVDGSGVTQPISGTVVSNIGSGSLTGITNTVTVKADSLVNQTNAFKVDGSSVVQPISVASLPLPTQASTSALQTTANTSLSSIDTKTPALGQALAAASTPVVLPAAQITALTPPTSVGLTAGTNAIGSITNTTFGATQSGNWNIGSITTLPSLPTGANTIGAISNTAFSINGTLPAFATTPTVNIGTAPNLTFTNTSFIANAGTNLNTSALALESGGNLAGINTKLPSNLGPKTAATSFPVTLSSDGAFSTAFGAASDSAATSDTANTGFVSLFKRFLERTASWGLSATPWFTKSNTYFQSYTIAKNAEAVAYAAGDVYGTKFELANFGPASGGGILLTGITLVSSVTSTTFPAGMGLFTLYLFSSEPLGIADNAAFAIHNDSFTQQGIPLNSLSLVTNATNPSSVNYQINTLFRKGNTSWWGYLVTNSAFTPTNNTANTMTIILSGMES